MVATGADGTGVEHIERLAALGFDYVELPLAETAALSEADFQSLKARVHSSGLVCETMNNFFPKTIRLTGDGVDMDAVMCYVQKALDRAAALGAKIVVFGSGGAKNVPDGFPLDEGALQVVELLRRVAPLAKARGITVAIEPLRKAECNLINSFKTGAALARAVHEDSVRVLVDYYHMTVEGEPASHVASLGREYLRHVHFARPDGRVFPTDISEDAGYRAFIDALRQAGYDQRISCEAYANNFDLDAERALRFFKDNF